jgi:small multidrug resistance family-3 protein
MSWLPTLLSLLLAAALEVGGDASLRHGLRGARPLWQLSGAAMLVLYGVFVNANRTADFSRLLGVYVAIFFVVSQLIGALFFGEAPTRATLLGGLLIVAGGAVLQLA